MKILKLFSLSLVLSFGLFALANVSHAQTTADIEDPMQLTTTVVDEITAESLDLEEKDTSFWSKFRLNVQSVFTFDPAKQVTIDLKKANVQLLTAKQLASDSTDSKIQERFQKALEKYKEKMANAEKRIEKLPADKKETALQRIDEHHLKQQQLLRDLSDRLPEQVKEKIIEVRKERINDWYEHNKENVQNRLEKASQAIDNGDRFNNLQIMATLGELSENLPVEAQVKVRAAINDTQNRLNVKLKNLNTADQEKFEHYLKSINIDEIKRVQLIDRLDTNDVSLDLRYRIQNLKNKEVNNLEERFKILGDDDKEVYLKKYFQSGESGEATKIEILNKLKLNTSQELRVKIQDINEEQEYRIKEKIRYIEDKDDLERLERDSRQSPVIRREIEERRRTIDDDDEDDDNDDRYDDDDDEDDD